MTIVYITKGDLYLEVGLAGTRILVQSNLVKAASTVLAAKVAEAQDCVSSTGDKKPIVALPDDEPEVIMALMRIINKQITGQLLYKFLDAHAVDDLYELLQTASKYNCIQVLDSEQQHNTISPPSAGYLREDAECMLQFVCIAHTLGFTKAYETAVRQLTLSYHMPALRAAYRQINASFLPEHFLSNIAEDQTRLINEMLVMLDKVMGTLEEGFPVIPSDTYIVHYCTNDEEHEACAFKHHGIYVDRLSKVSLWPIPDDARDVPYTVKELYSHARSALRNEVEEPCASFGDTDDEWTSYHWDNRVFFMPWSTSYDFFMEGTEDFLPVRPGEIPDDFTEEL